MKLVNLLILLALMAMIVAMLVCAEGAHEVLKQQLEILMETIESHE